jgi:parallel beta-helix repeat protein
MTKPWLALAAVSLVLSSVPASAAVIVITQAKANAGGVTPGDAPGFPVTLSLPGAYRFETNLTVPAGKEGVKVLSHYVDIDMNGFRLYGWNAAGTTRIATAGVTSTFGASGIRNGYITGFKQGGIRLIGNSNQWVVRDMLIQSNGDAGIDARDSSYTRILTSSIHSNLATGIRCGDYCHIEGNSISSNGNFGVFLESGTVLGNTIFANGLEGIGNNGGDAGFGNNTVIDNNGGGAQVFGAVPMHANLCIPAC